MTQSIGLIKWFDNDKGFGVLGTVDKIEVFIHGNQFIDKPEKILKAKVVFFDYSEENKGKNAINVTNPQTYEHFKYIMSLNENNPKVNIEFTVKGKSRWGNEYQRKEFKDVSIFDYAIHQVLRNKTPEEVKLFFINYFNEKIFENVEEVKKRFQLTRDIINKLEFKTINVNHDNNEVSGVKSYDVIIEIFKHYISNTEEKYLFDIWKQSYHYPIILSNSFIHNIFKNKYSFPDSIFIDNYKCFNDNLLEKILKSHKREDICHNIILKKIDDYNEVNEINYSEINSCLSVLYGSNVYDELNEKLRKKNIENFLYDKEKLNESEFFNRFLNLINKSSVGNQKHDAIELINQNLDDETKLRYWQEFKYFTPSNEFLYKNLEKLNRYDFLNAPSNFHDDYFEVQYNKLNYDNSLISFCNLVFLLLEIPGYQTQKIENNFSQKYKVAFWLFDTYFNENNKREYYEEYQRFVIDFSIINFIDYLNKSENLDEIIYLIKIINEIFESFKFQKTENNLTNNLFKFSQDEKIKTIDEIILKLEFNLKVDSIDIFKCILLDYSQLDKNDIIKIFIPSFINPNEEKNFDKLLNFEEIINNNSEYRDSYYVFLSEFVSNQNKIILWYNEYINEIEISSAINYLIESPEDIQYKILKKIFSSIHLNKKLITNELFVQFESLSNNSTINFNVRLALYVVNSLKINNQFINDKTIFELVSQRLNENINEIIKIDEFLEACKGRTWKVLSYNSDDKEEWYVNINGHEFHVNDSMIRINDKNYYLNKENKSVCIKGIYYNFKWVKKRNVFHTENYGVPDGLTFCDAVKSQFDENTNSNFYWCCNSKCHSPCQKDYNPFQWENYTLRDFIKILRINFDNDLYYRFVAVVNRVNRLLEKLKCNSCEKLMRDASTSEFAFYRVNTFHCTNSECDEFHKSVYLTHCLNWRCLNIIDTRISKACPNGWYICDKCDNCCSQEKIDMRYQNLLTNAAFNPNNIRHQKLKFQVDNKMGHLEKNEIYNYLTGEKN